MSSNSLDQVGPPEGPGPDRLVAVPQCRPGIQARTFFADDHERERLAPPGKDLYQSERRGACFTLSVDSSNVPSGFPAREVNGDPDWPAMDARSPLSLFSKRRTRARRTSFIALRGGAFRSLRYPEAPFINSEQGNVETSISTFGRRFDRHRPSSAEKRERRRDPGADATSPTEHRFEHFENPRPPCPARNSTQAPSTSAGDEVLKTPSRLPTFCNVILHAIVVRPVGPRHCRPLSTFVASPDAVFFSRPSGGAATSGGASARATERPGGTAARPAAESTAFRGRGPPGFRPIVGATIELGHARTKQADTISHFGKARRSFFTRLFLLDSPRSPSPERPSPERWRLKWRSL